MSKIITLIILSIFAPLCQANAQTAVDTLCHTLDSLCQPMQRTSLIGMMVYDLDRDTLLYARNEHQTMRPASVMKTITAITALDRLGSKYRIKTLLRYTGEICDSTRTLNGNLYLVGGMDSKLNNDDLAAFADSLHSMGIDTIRGIVCFDHHMKDTLMWGEGWCWDDDNPTLTPLLYDGKAELAEQFLKNLKAHNIFFDSTLVMAPTPESAITIASRYHTIDQILKRMLKDSNNLFAETLFYHTALSATRPATADAARKITHDLIHKMGLEPKDYRVADGSGLSLYNYITPELVMHYLLYAHADEHIYRHLYPALPVAGTDGTLANRMVRSVADGRVHAKTGTVTGVSSLAGYINTVTNRHFAFVIIINGTLDTKSARDLQDQLCIHLCSE